MQAFTSAISELCSDLWVQVSGVMLGLIGAHYAYVGSVDPQSVAGSDGHLNIDILVFVPAENVPSRHLFSPNRGLAMPDKIT
jgi:hypothetical protein